VLRILAITDDKTLSYHKRTGLKPDDEMPASPRGSFRGDVRLEDVCMKPVCDWTFSRRIPPNSKLAESHPTQHVSLALQHQAVFLSGIRNLSVKSLRFLVFVKMPLPRHYWRQRNTLYEIAPPSGTMNTRYCMWNIDNDLKEIIEIYFHSCMEDKAHNELVKQFPKPDVLALHSPELQSATKLVETLC